MKGGRGEGMRICLLSYRGNPYCGGQGIYVYYLARALRNLGHEVSVISGPPHPECAEGVEAYQLNSLNLYETHKSFLADLSQVHSPIDLFEFVEVCLGTFPEPLTFSLRAYGKIRQLIATRKFDIIHDNQGLGYGMLFMKRLKIPVVATIHHPIPIDRDLQIAEAETLRRKLRLKMWYSFCAMQKIVSRRMDRVITVSQSSADAIERTLKVPRDRLRIAYNGIDIDFFKRDGNVAKMPNSLILVNSGEQSIKGVPYLLKALYLLKGRTEVKLTIVGSSNPDGQYPRLVREYGLEDTVTFTGRVTMEGLVRQYLSSEICVIPSLYEGFGFPAAEAMSCHLPVISTTAGALPEVVGRDGETGIIVPPAAPEALATAIESLLGDENLRRKMGEAARKRVEKEFTWEQAAKKTLEVYEEVL